jgi:hypothetical protein
MNEEHAIQAVEQPEYAMSVKGHIEQRNKIMEVMRQVMKQDVHYGTIPGTQKPTLLKPGAERLCMTFGISAGADNAHMVEDLSEDGAYRYRVTIPFYSRATGVFLGFGIGECSTNEEKYKWRSAVCDQEYLDTDETERRIKWKKDRSGRAFAVKQVRTNAADLANTALKIAKKRAFVDGPMSITGASEVFTQDVEDLPQEYVMQETPSEQAMERDRDKHASHKADTGPVVLPSTKFYGKNAGKPVPSVSDEDLEWYIRTLQNNVDDPSRAKFRADNSRWLELFKQEAESRRPIEQGQSPSMQAQTTQEYATTSKQTMPDDMPHYRMTVESVAKKTGNNGEFAILTLGDEGGSTLDGVYCFKTPHECGVKDYDELKDQEVFIVIEEEPSKDGKKVFKRATDLITCDQYDSSQADDYAGEMPPVEAYEGGLKKSRRRMARKSSSGM